MNRRLAITLFLMMVAPLAKAEPFTFERGMMGTRFAITCYHEDKVQATAAANTAFDAAECINQVASDYIADSELLSLSKYPAATAVTGSPLLYQLISEARDLAEKTKGSFDPTLGPLTKLWRESRRRNLLPDDDILAAARAASGWDNLILDPHKQTVTLMKPAMRLDLGGIAKGQAADAMLAVMRQRGIPRSCITAGGDVRLGDPPPAAKGWKIGVRTMTDIDQPENLILSNCGISTSGDLHQFVEIGGTRYSHIIDPATGLGLTNGNVATVIAPTATISDALATACCVTPIEKAKSMALASGATEVYLTPHSDLRKR